MILNSDFLLPHFKEKMRQGSRDASRHVLCPECKVRTKLYTLKDGRKKCSVCRKKFNQRSVNLGSSAPVMDSEAPQGLS